MKKKIFLIGIIFFSFFFLLTACDKKEEVKKEDETIEKDDKKEDETIEKDDKKEKKDDRDNPYIEDPSMFENEVNMEKIANKSSYDLIVGDKINPIYEDKREAYLYKVSDENVISVNSLGEVEALAKGEAKLRIYKEGLTRIKYIGYVNFKIEPKDEINYNCTKEMYDELSNKFNSYDTDDVKIKTSVITNSIETKSEVSYRKDPFYYEMTANGGNDDLEHIIVEKANNIFVIYQLNDTKKSLKKTTVANYTVDMNEIINSADIDDLEFDKIELNKISSDEYEIKYSIKDMLSSLKELIGDIDSSMLLDGLVKMNVTFAENQINITFKITLHMFYSDSTLNIPYDINIEMVFDDVEEFDLSDYKFYAPDKIEDCYELYDDSEFYVKYYGTAYLYKHLEAGKYAIEAEEPFFNDNMNITIYDEDRFNLDLEDSHIRNINNSFTIPEEGNYYIKVIWGISTDQKLELKKLDYTVSNEAKLFESSKGKIDGAYDFNKYYYQSNDENELLKITNNTENPLYLYFENVIADDWSNTLIIESGKIDYINPSKNSIIYVTSSIPSSYSYNGEYEYDFTVEKIDASLGRDMNNPVLLTDEYSNDLFYNGCGLSDLYFKIKVDKKSVLSFSAKSETGYITRLSYFREIYSTNYCYESILEAGEYVYVYSDSNKDLKAYYLKLELIDISDKDVNIEIKTKTSEDDTANIYVDSAKSHKEQIVKHHFTLEQDEIIRTYFDEVSIYDSNDKKMNFKLSGYGCIKLKAGSYYAIYDGSYSRFVLSKISYNPKTYIDFDNLDKLDLNGLSFNKNQGLDNEILVYEYVPTTDIKIEFKKNNLYLNIIDVDFNKVESSLGEYKFNANEKYYVIIYGISTTWEDATLSINEVN